MGIEQVIVEAVDGTPIGVTRRRSSGPPVVLLHAGVADRRAWTAVIEQLAGDEIDLIAYDRRGYGDTPAVIDPSSFTHVDDLIRVLDDAGHTKALLVGNSMGGAIAIDAALMHPERVIGLVLIGAAVSGMTDDDTPFDWELDPASAPLLQRIEDPGTGTEAKIAALAHLWLDGPAAVEGRVNGAARDLFITMNEKILEVDAPDSAGDAGVDAWTRLGELSVPTLCAYGDLDIPADIPFYEETARRIGRGPAQVLTRVAHLPGLEQPQLIAELIQETFRDQR